jgi:succinyl-diaminopimelate desuccinylase
VSGDVSIVARARRAIEQDLAASRDRLIDMCARLVRTPSENPPGDTRAVVGVVRELLTGDPLDVTTPTGEPSMPNVVVRVGGARPGRRLIFNGHLDTFAVGDPAGWSVDPLGGVVRDDRIYGRGVSDMKGGLAASLMAMLVLARYRDAWAGEVVATLASDEETMGPWGTQYLLETVPEASGDAMISGDAGSPRVVRFGEKGLIWLRVTACGRAAHGAHVHLGESAVERLVDALSRLCRLRDLSVPAPPAVLAAIRAAAPVSEALSGRGETETMTSVTVNLGVIAGGRKINLVADSATAEVDVRLPVGVRAADAIARAEALVSDIPGVALEVLRRFEPSVTDPKHEIVQLVVANATRVLGTPPVATVRVGASDTRYYRGRGIPTVVYGPAPSNMGAADESITLHDLFAVADVHTLTAFDYLSAGAPVGA